jgi:hypothetical protein
MTAWSTVFRQYRKQGLDIDAASAKADAWLQEQQPTLHYEAPSYPRQADCGVHVPVTHLSADPSRVTCGRCKRRANFPGGI